MGKGFEFSRCSSDEQYAAQSRRPALDERTHKINQRVMMRGLLGTVTRCEKGRFSGHGFVCWRSQAMSWEISKGD